ncbi:hypothetical protein CHS0354_023772 [Potamilus streckersoni]|uniref:UDP-N-acetylmuramoyl-L-alanyl-D-glutamate synthetase n=1 Tax=Potamilus streckersoni TaxID=2493646 RepID=A0AAE0RZ77_9BIVA|nr:hypothetical protein CHS0354_023772 [Potamilus streckersoni]
MQGKKVTVLGAKKSGLSASRLLKKKGADVFVSDISKENEAARKELISLGIDCEFGKHSERIMECDFCVVSPGIPEKSPVIKKMEQAGKKIVSEIEMSSWFCKSKLVGVTGSEGKTTTTTLISKILDYSLLKNPYSNDEKSNRLRRAFAVGNIGNPLADYVDMCGENDVLVVEISSFQLDRCYTFKPNIAVITTITKNHLDRYDSFEHYANSKYRIFQNQTVQDTLIYNYENEVLREKFATYAEDLEATLFPVSLHEKNVADKERAGFLSKRGEFILRNSCNHEGKLLKQEEVILNLSELEGKISLSGEHNWYNALMAVAVARLFDVNIDKIRSELKYFEGIEHRLEFVKTVGGIQFINDSKSTSVNSLLQALKAITGEIYLILGGKDKGNDYSVVYEQVQKKVPLIVALGESRGIIEKSFNEITKVVVAETLPEAVCKLYKIAQAPSTVLLSPACASFDMFTGGFEERGRVFKDIVKSLPKEKNRENFND